MIYLGATIGKQIGDSCHETLIGDGPWEKTAGDDRTNALRHVGEMEGLSSSMRRKMAAAILSLSIAILLSGCGRREEAPDVTGLTPESYKELKEDGKGVATEETEEGDSFRAGLNGKCSCVAAEEGFEVTFFNGAHEIIFSECYPKEPTVRQVTDNIFEVRMSVGSSAVYVFYVDVVNAETSGTFFNPLLFGEHYVAHMEDGELILRDIFDDDALCMTISRDFTKTVNPMSAIIAIEMQDKNKITLSYYKGDNCEETSEILYIGKVQPWEGGFQIRESCLLSAEGQKGGTLEIPYGVTRTVDQPSADGCVRAVVGQYAARGDNVQYEEIILPETMVRIGDGSFNSTKIDRIIFPASLREIGTFAFRWAALDEVVMQGGLKTIGDGAFSDTSLMKVQLPDTLEYIGRWAFADTPLKEMEIPASVRYIGQGAFEHCGDLSKIVFEEGVSTIDCSFCDYSSVERLQFPESLSVLEGSGFFIPSLKRIYIPKGTTVIDDEKFFRAFVTYGVPVVVYGQSGSRAEEVADAWGMEFVEVASGDEMP